MPQHIPGRVRTRQRGGTRVLLRNRNFFYTGALSSVSGVIVLIGSSVTGSLLDLDLPPAVPWLILAAVPALAVAILPSCSER